MTEQLFLSGSGRRLICRVNKRLQVCPSRLPNQNRLSPIRNPDCPITRHVFYPFRSQGHDGLLPAPVALGKRRHDAHTAPRAPALQVHRMHLLFEVLPGLPTQHARRRARAAAAANVSKQGVSAKGTAANQIGRIGSRNEIRRTMKW